MRFKSSQSQSWVLSMGKIPLASNQWTQFALLWHEKEISAKRIGFGFLGWVAIGFALLLGMASSLVQSCLSPSLSSTQHSWPNVWENFSFLIALGQAQTHNDRQTAWNLKESESCALKRQVYVSVGSWLLTVDSSVGLFSLLAVYSWPTYKSRPAVGSKRLHAGRAILWKFLATSQPRLASQKCLHLKLCNHSNLSISFPLILIFSLSLSPCIENEGEWVVEDALRGRCFAQITIKNCFKWFTNHNVHKTKITTSLNNLRAGRSFRKLRI